MPNKNNILRCSNCGASDIKFDEESGKLKCQNCRSLIDGIMANEADDISALKGKIISGGANKIIDSKSMVTLKCSACGAETTINTDEATSARCPWCRHILSITDKMQNGAVPDLILPFKIKHDEAVKVIRDYVNKHRSIARRGFISEFKDDAVVGVYLPYMVVDMNVHAKMSGDAEMETRRYTVGTGDDCRTCYDADVYGIEREFDLEIDDLTIEASSNRLNQNTKVNTNHIINAIMPFDTDKAIDWDPRFVRGYYCEHRDVDVEDLDRRVKLQVEDIMRYRMHGSIAQYMRGVRWDKMRLEQSGVKWKTAYLPVWLYSYLDVNNKGKSVLHYVAVNGRTKEIVGSTPIDWPRVFINILAFPGAVWLLNLVFSGLASRGIKNEVLSSIVVYLGVAGVFWVIGSSIAMAIKVSAYRNRDARHMYEKETRAKVENMVSSDIFKKSLKGLSYSMMPGRNDNVVKGIIRDNGRRGGVSSTILLSVMVIIASIVISCVMMGSVLLHANNFRNDRSRTTEFYIKPDGSRVRVRTRY
jgi:DNA-directed RNA polymerase subunit RPC12/RpoP